MQDYLNALTEWLASYGPRVLAALAILAIGLVVASMIRSTFLRVLTRAEVDRTLSVFLSRLGYMLVLAFVVIASIGELGVDTTSLAAAIAAVGLAIGLALQGSLSNFAAGVLLIALRPFKVGDYIEAGGTAGTVEAVSIFATELASPDNTRIIVPNSAIAGGNITNYSTKETRRIDLVVGIGYGDDIRKAKGILEKILADDARVLPEPAPTIAVSELGESSVNLVVRPWVKAAEYWALRFDLTERIKLRFDEEGVSIPFPQRDVHLHELKAVAEAS